MVDTLTISKKPSKKKLEKLVDNWVVLLQAIQISISKKQKDIIPAGQVGKVIKIDHQHDKPLVVEFRMKSPDGLPNGYLWYETNLDTTQVLPLIMGFEQ